MKEIRNKKILNGIIGFILFFVILFGGFWLIDNLFTKEVKAQENESVVNLASPDLTGKEYLGNGVYRLYNGNGVTIDYNVYNGVIDMSGTSTGVLAYNFLWFPNTLNEYMTLSVRYVSGEVVSGNNEIGILNNGAGAGIAIRPNTYLTPLLSQSQNNVNQLLIYLASGSVLTNYRFTLQLEWGTVVTDYQVPIQPYLWHEKRLSYGEGYDDGYDDGYDVGYDDGSIFGNSFVIGSLIYDEMTSTDYILNFAFNNLSTDNIGDILVDVGGAFGGSRYALFTVRQAYNLTFDYELRNSAFNIIEIMPRFDTIMFFADTDEMAILLNGSVVKYYNNSMGVGGITLKYTGFPNEDYSNGYNAGLDDGEVNGYGKGYNDGWYVGYDYGIDFGHQPSYDLGYDDGYGYGYNDGLTINPNDNFGSLITTILLGVGTVLGIELLPNITIGAIIAVPIVFGIIAFVLGRKKE